MLNIVSHFPKPPLAVSLWKTIERETLPFLSAYTIYELQFTTSKRNRFLKTHYREQTLHSFLCGGVSFQDMLITGIIYVAVITFASGKIFCPVSPLKGREFKLYYYIFPSLLSKNYQISEYFNAGFYKQKIVLYLIEEFWDSVNQILLFENTDIEISGYLTTWLSFDC